MKSATVSHFFRASDFCLLIKKESYLSLPLWNKIVQLQKFLVGLFTLFLLATPLRPLFLFIQFKVNQSYISQELCENRARPNLNCKGKCYLMKKIAQLEQQQEAKTSQPPVMPDWEKERIPFYATKAEIVEQPHSIVSTQSNEADWFLLSTLLQPDTPPPDLS